MPKVLIGHKTSKRHVYMIGGCVSTEASELRALGLSLFFRFLPSSISMFLRHPGPGHGLLKLHRGHDRGSGGRGDHRRGLGSALPRPPSFSIDGRRWPQAVQQSEVPVSMLPDVVEADEEMTGRRREGTRDSSSRYCLSCWVERFAKVARLGVSRSVPCRTSEPQPAQPAPLSFQKLARP